MSRAQVLSVTVALLLAACTHDETVDRRSCEKLRDHLVDVRVSTAGGAPDPDATQHRAAMTAALGDSFVEDCENKMSVGQLQCAMRATDLGATADCARSN